MDKTKLLDNVTFSGLFKKRTDNELIEYSGLICLDIDKIDNPEELKQRLIKSKLPIVLMFNSPSGHGLKVVLLSSDDERNHLKYFEYYQSYFRQYYGIVIDKSCKNISRTCFMSYDKEVYYKDPNEMEEIKLDDETSKFILSKASDYILSAKDGEKHHKLLNISRLLGGYSAGGLISADKAINALETFIIERGNIDNLELAKKTIRDGFTNGIRNPLTKDDLFDFEKRIKIQFTNESNYENTNSFITEYSDFVFDNLPPKINEIIDKYSKFSGRSYLLFILIGLLPNLFTKFRFSYNGTTLGLNLGTVAVALSASGKSASGFIVELFSSIENHLNKSEKVNGTKKTLFLPPNISAIELAERLNANCGTGTLYSTEISEFTSTNAKEFGDYDYILRKGLSNENISIMRKTDKTDINIDFPLINFCLTGTNSQFPEMFKDINNGFFSRSLYFLLDNSILWNRGNASRVKQDNKALKQFFFEKYVHYQSNIPEFIIPIEVEEYFDDEMEKENDKYCYDDLMISIVRRYGVYTWKLARIIKLMESDYTTTDKIVIDLTTMKLCLEITTKSIKLSEYLSFNLKSNGKSEEDRIVSKLKMLNRTFTRAESLVLTEGLISVRSLDRLLANRTHFTSEGHGKYKSK
ncbi:MAG: DUF3987 domain-containing protein [Melioribacteraceae bacterium]|nr:DUF3987 domain-containing protein [Melioribacteraceae bacterium]